MTRLRIAQQNVGNGTDDRVTADVRNLLEDIGVQVAGLEEMGDRARVADRIDKLGGVTVLRKAKGSQNRVALVLDEVTATEWGTFPLNPGHEPIERTVAGGSDGTAEPKHIVWADILGAEIGASHFIPSTAVRKKLPSLIAGRREWKHPLAREVYKVQVRRAVEWFEQGGDVLLVDANGTPDYDLLAPLRAVADCYAVPSRKKPNAIDHIYVRKGSGIKVDLDSLRASVEGSSDHPAIVLDIDIPANHRPPLPNVRAAQLIERAAQTAERPMVKAIMLSAAASVRAGEK